ncbi:sensor histidine kinase [Kineothrix sp. MB12-C1]|uniref:sensor histidine kinase n=1 Tax=Kineothrix sp. MB12-C1 TaxID=3070215 RepID=UPI0027D23F85|nr:sensor histidine kinase [Kineothrix sp. MB12-C1]WMC94232.1 sensor histidine kinase [Kineothrix sp. MB12-C1]
MGIRKVGRLISYFNIRQKIIFYVYLVISPIFILITTFILISNYNDTKYKQIEADSNVVRSLDKSISVIQTELSDLSVYICINSDIGAILLSDDPGQLSEDSRLWYSKAPMKIIQDIIALKGYIKTLAIYPENGVKPYLRCIDSSVHMPDIESVRQTAIYQQALEKRGDIIWSRVNYGEDGIYQANYTDKIVMYREIFDMAKKEKLGYLVLGINAEKYTDLCKTAVGQENEGIIILSSEGKELTRYGTVDEEILSYISGEEYLQQDHRKRAVYFEHGAYNVFCSQEQKKGVIVCKMVPKSNGGKQLNSIMITPILMLIGLLFVLWPLLELISNIISRPLRRLCIAMNQFQGGDFNQQVIVESQDEIGEVTECFNHMVLSIKELIDRNYVMALKEKESELIALQAQINPHFLYNTLDSLYWRTQSQGNEELAEDILALSQLFRLVLGQGKGIIPVRMEKDLITNYLHIQKMRFNKRLEYEIDIEEDILDESIPKLILQPFVENAIVHGFEGMEKGGFLKVTGKRQNEQLIFMISDNGIGMTKEQIDAIWNIEDTKRYANQRIGRYAIKNVKERLELKYRQNFELLITSRPDRGTEVIISLKIDDTKPEKQGNIDELSITL